MKNKKNTAYILLAALLALIGYAWLISTPADPEVVKDGIKVEEIKPVYKEYEGKG